MQSSEVSPATAEESPGADSRWVGLFRTGAISAAVVVLIYLFELLLVILKGPPPTTVDQWFAVLKDGRSLGILRSFALDIAAITLLAPRNVALYFFLRKAVGSNSALVIALVLSLIGIAVYLASNVTFSMVSLSDQLTSAATEAQRSQVLAAGQALMSVYNGTGPFVAFNLFAIAGILFSVLMLKSAVVPKFAAIVGIVGNAFDLGLPPEIPLFSFQVTLALIGVGGVLVIVWNIFICATLFQRSPSSGREQR